MRDWDNVIAEAAAQGQRVFELAAVLDLIRSFLIESEGISFCLKISPNNPLLVIKTSNLKLHDSVFNKNGCLTLHLPLALSLSANCFTVQLLAGMFSLKRQW